ncbi:MAG TPA: type IV pilus twitching motility protein PilT [Candidatus Limnocylindrales bacterium]|nr:type IV pilus twitching motility protein PilT [Candidatus Limnocylindrales bacterium]
MRRRPENRFAPRNPVGHELEEAAERQAEGQQEDRPHQVAEQLSPHDTLQATEAERSKKATSRPVALAISSHKSAPAPSTGPGLAIEAYLQVLLEQGASDLILSAGAPPTMRKDGILVPIAPQALRPDQTEQLTHELLSPERWSFFLEHGDLDFSFNWQGRARFRINAFRQRGSVGMVMRLIPYQVPNFDQLGVPQVVRGLTSLPQGLILVTGPTGSGKSSTLAAMVNDILSTSPRHVITIEDPIEYVYRHQVGVVEQREVGSDVASFPDALRAALRQTPDVLLIGEMRDLETITTAITVAETGHLVLATLHTNDTTQAVDRMVDVFPAEQQQQVRVQLSSTLAAVIYQQLLPRRGGGRVAAFEVLLNTLPVQNLIKEGKTRQLRNIVATSSKDGMTTMERSLTELIKAGLVEPARAAARSQYPEELKLAS